ncbi:transmembrane protein 177 [Lutzomyia longipalpis]|uniref:transmembrane protein 177 n=1 Tax=Lutzomyia longipalpis TaxID=7200 RepID=UPI002483E34E|nr:transmembrane protein 177 [Lutzomyia longipalpis]
MFGKVLRNKHIWVHRGTTGAIILSFSAFYLPHTVFLDRYKEFMACYKDGIVSSLPEKILQRFDAACKLLNLKERESKLIKPFATFGFDLFYAGTVKSHYGAYIGIPTNYLYDNEGQIDKKNIKLQTEPIKWASPEGELLSKSLILDEDEQIYGIAHCILMTRNHQRFLNGIYASGTIFGTYVLGHFINKQMQLHSRPFFFRGVLYGILGLFGFGLWALMKDATQVYYEGAADDALGDISPEMANAGVRFYSKIMEKNIALRRITKKDNYSTEGDICYTIRMKSFPYTARKALLEEKLKTGRHTNEEPK